jgi:aminocarboxymuconate-semialdehyde decarboxylase
MPARTLDLHTHHYTPAFFGAIRDSGGDYSFARDPTGRDIITLRGARFFGITPAMTDLTARLAAMDQAGIDVAVLSLSTPNVFFLPPDRQAGLARQMNDAYAAATATSPRTRHTSTNCQAPISSGSTTTRSPSARTR